MPAVSCPYPNCEYVTDDLDATIVAALINAHSLAHAQHTNGQNQTAKVTVKAEKVRRPTISVGGSSEDWAYFINRWTDYVIATGITGRDCTIQLLECCEENLRKDLTRSHGDGLRTKTEADLLEAIKSLAVREENIMVARVTLHGMKQDREESVRAFGARIKGQAGVCKLSVKCPNCERDVSYKDDVLKDVLARGIADQEIQLDLLSDSNQDRSLEEMFKFVEIKETGKMSASHINNPALSHTIPNNVNATSTYRQNKRQQPQKAKELICSYCGKSGHGTNALATQRKSVCPAFGHKCGACDKLHHFEQVCRSKSKVNKIKNEHAFCGPRSDYDSHTDNDSPDLLSTVEQSDTEFICSLGKDYRKTDMTNPIAIDHYLYDNLNATWVRKGSQPQPYVNVQISTSHDDYKALGFNLNAPPKTVSTQAMADTGCQSCLAGEEFLHRLGLTRSNLIPVTMRMHTADNKGIRILGATMLHIKATQPDGTPITTRQMTYITDATDKFFLSRETCVQLKIIPSDFPTIGGISALSECSCPRREAPPPPPPTLPYPATEENVPLLGQFLLKYYGSSTFNTCEHQQLPLMEGPPLKLMIDPEAKPVAYHTPIPVPIHWQKEVKEGLDQDVRLGVLEPVPIGEKVTWCHRMVICAKKNGKPRRTVDFQPLNKFAARETHHTPSPFHQARSASM